MGVVWRDIRGRAVGAKGAEFGVGKGLSKAWVEGGRA